MMLQEPVRHQAGGQAEPRAVRAGHVADRKEAEWEGPSCRAHAGHGSAQHEAQSSKRREFKL